MRGKYVVPPNAYTYVYLKFSEKIPKKYTNILVDSVSLDCTTAGAQVHSRSKVNVNGSANGTKENQMSGQPHTGIWSNWAGTAKPI